MKRIYLIWHKISRILPSLWHSRAATNNNKTLLPIVSNGPATIFKDRTGKLVIGKRLRLSAPIYAEFLSRNTTFIRIGTNSSLIIEGETSLWPGVAIIVSDDANLVIGDGTSINVDSKIHATNSITIGSNCAISWNVTIIDSDFHMLEPSKGNNSSAAVVIGNNVWIGSNVSILKGVTIHEGAVIAAGSVVTKDVPPHTLVAGIPASVKKENVSWWNEPAAHL